MKKLLPLLFVTAIISISASSCKKCGYCSDSTPSSKICNTGIYKLTYDLTRDECKSRGEKWIVE